MSGEIPINQQRTLLGGEEIMKRVGILHGQGRAALEAYVASCDAKQHEVGNTAIETTIQDPGIERATFIPKIDRERHGHAYFA
jgi:hypothetical protein